MDITKLDLKELKALAYDCLAIIEAQRENLRIIDIEIKKRLAVSAPAVHMDSLEVLPG